MAPPTLPVAPTSMRLTVEVLPLAAEHAHGPSRVQALADMKARRFALPVQVNHTFRQVWGQIEERYKKNYLNAQQAAAFTINKLQDAYDCDLDVDDTVGSIFEGEADPTMRKIKVVPSFVDRDFSVPVTSNLRPASAQKRLLEVAEERANKRRRINHSQLHCVREESHPLRDQPLPTTESELCGEDISDEAANGLQAAHRSSRSHTGASLVFVHGGQTGDAEFGSGIKAESPELGDLPRQPTPEVAQIEAMVREPSIPLRKETPRGARLQKNTSRSRTPHQSAPQVSEGHVCPLKDITQDSDLRRQQKDGLQSITTNEKAVDTAILRSPESTPSHMQQTPPVASRRKDLYEISSSPEFVGQKSSSNMTTYGRSPKTVQKAVALMNRARRLSVQAQRHTPTKQSPSRTSLEKTHAYPLAQSDFIESTQQDEEVLIRSRHVQNGVSTPIQTTPAKTSRPGSLKKPSRTSQSAIKAANDIAASSSQRGIGTPKSTSTPRNVDPSVQARLDRLRQRKKVPPVLADQSSRRGSLQSNTSAQSTAATFSPPVSIDKTDTESGTSAKKKASSETATPIQPQVEPETVARLPSQPATVRATTQRTPVPLPANIRNLSPKNTSLHNNSTTSDVRKPTLEKLNFQSEGGNEHSRQRESPNTHPASAKTSAKHSSAHSSHQAAPAQKAGSGTTPISTATVPKKRGRPRKNPVVEPAAAPGPFADPSRIEPPQAESIAPISSKTSSQAKSVGEEVIMVSSAESESSEDPEEDETSHNVSAAMANSSTVQPELQPENEIRSSQLPRTSENGLESVEQSAEQQSSVRDQVARSLPTQAQDSLAQTQKNQKKTPWNSNSWDFGNIADKDGVSSESISNQEANARAASSQPLSNGKNESISDAGLAREEESKSRSVSPAVSTRSSPALTRRPARFLSHSPTPDGSDAEDNSEETSASPSKASTPQAVNNESGSNSDSASSDSDSDGSATDNELPDAPPPASSTQPLSSSLPQPTVQSKPPQSTPMVPETSQPVPAPSQPYKRTPIPLPPNSQLPSTASPSLQRPATTAARAGPGPSSASLQTPNRRPTLSSKSSQFTGLKDQLVQVQTLTGGAKGKLAAAFDPRNMNLGKLFKAGARAGVPVGAPNGVKSKPGVNRAGSVLAGLEGGSSSSDESSSSSSSSSDSDSD